jgi:FkbM family methyltransferase
MVRNSDCCKCIFITYFVDPTLIVLGFEADTSSFGRSYHNTKTLLQKNDSLWPQFKIFPLGLSDQEGMMKLNLNYADACASLLPSHPDAWWCAHTIGHMAVPVVRLDTILDMLPSDYVLHYLKVDTEGNDVNVMKGAGKYMN